MRKMIGPATALGLVLAASAAPAANAGSALHHAHRHERAAQAADRPARRAVQPQPDEPLLPTMTPYTRSGEGDNNGLSRNPDDCATGCIGGNAD
jgi:hypothetical protein